jgi:F-type H+-transporting ATPase subunit b
MLIDWFTVGAQVLNFLILVWLLKRFLYQPILTAIDAREARIANELADAENLQKAANSEREEFSKKNVQFEQLRSKLLAEATEAANKQRHELLAAARTAADALTAKHALQLRIEQQNLHHELSGLARAQVLSIARKALTELANIPLESAIVRTLVLRLEQLPEEPKAAFAEAIHQADNCLSIHSAFELAQPERAQLQLAINMCFSRDIKLNYDAVDAVLGGVELAAGGQVLGWTIDGYLTALEQNIAEVISQKMQVPTTHPDAAIDVDIDVDTDTDTDTDRED